ncbi:hypothetical protein [Weissella confusa]|uniref:Uncharacterized protein n=1 Tax=Weissella confusa TaxID=1583 RepID=A0AAJ2YYR7_WEICO|nr:hypothetical protein [Weissella confusa]MBJ7643143.1 hypothetical protein [Weissella confusa]MBJ7654352.1 hypothetical protein [Weissella confusa]MBJ7694151.1 hypothetical protein [Weissella confusa]NBA12187.1 hypothetical protein [Weissella confusa]SJX69499.1 hypothetical protein FM131_07040 [Weissella confusa]
MDERRYEVVANYFGEDHYWNNLTLDEANDQFYEARNVVAFVGGDVSSVRIIEKVNS